MTLGTDFSISTSHSCKILRIYLVSISETSRPLLASEAKRADLESDLLPKDMPSGDKESYLFTNPR